jgi:hypothetical protein
MAEWRMNGDLERPSEGNGRTSIEAPYRNLRGGTENNHGSSQESRCPSPLGRKGGGKPLQGCEDPVQLGFWALSTAQ